MEPSASALRVAPRRHGWPRRAFFRGIESLASALGGRAFYRRRFLGPGRLVLREERIPVRGLPRALEGFTLAHLSDLHAGAFLARGDLAHVVECVELRGCAAAVITGDFISHRWEDALLVLEELGALRTRLGSFAVFGNHDYKQRLEGRIVDAARAHGIRFLRNEAVRLDHDGAGLVIAGLEDLEEARGLELAAARALTRPGDVEVLLVHNPTRARELARESCALVLAGHTHGTQIDLPFLRGLGPAHPGLRFRAGTTRVVVSRGLGAVGVPLRIGSPAEIVFATLVRDAS